VFVDRGIRNFALKTSFRDEHANQFLEKSYFIALTDIGRVSLLERRRLHVTSRSALP